MSKIVLYIEDDKEQIELYRLGFKIYSPEIEFHGEHDAVVALQKIKDIKPDLILLDMIMPAMDGLTVLKKLKGSADTKDIPVIAFTNSTRVGLQEESLKLGARDVWEKTSLIPKELALKVQKMFKNDK